MSWDDNLVEIPDFVVQEDAFDDLIGKDIRLQWPDVWKDAYYQGTLWDVLLSAYPDTGECVELSIQDFGNSWKRLVLPVGAEIKLWEIV